MTGEELDQFYADRKAAGDVFGRCYEFIDAVSNYKKDSTNPEVIDDLTDNLTSMQCDIIALIVHADIPLNKFRKDVIKKLIKYGI